MLIGCGDKSPAHNPQQIETMLPFFVLKQTRYDVYYSDWECFPLQAESH